MSTDTCSPSSTTPSQQKSTDCSPIHRARIAHETETAKVSQPRSPTLTRGNCSGGERTRTADFYVANVALYQLSYTPEGVSRIAPGTDLVFYLFRPRPIRVSSRLPSAARTGAGGRA